jgi:hypothetical protein
MHVERRHGASWTCHLDGTEYAVGVARSGEDRDRLFEELDRHVALLTSGAV